MDLSIDIIDIKCVFPDTSHDINKEKLCNIVVSKCASLIKLPNKIVLEFRKLHDSVYGEAILNSKDRIRLNVGLSLQETVLVLVHELIHISQIHVGQLTFSKKGDYIWENKVYCNVASIKTMAYKTYTQLPWELDVAKKQQNLLKLLLK